ncbi:hypothetical protein [Streptomyces lavendulae]|uniref:hypothetical protein n=1 Tax=Streptomyces lavendulae TaxID=1914 RepID=UPI0024A3EA94|nr:hypothetical protein [Streptomyces lavendulae]GLX19266.1 hypothetical protein Slala01_29100 [Streptomyces lavendulae subsp. lavendulae]GLX25985.1 hypothetical protein Slala02_18050 [Streptomyces lavendulae subsp. lavendulae]
MRTEAYGTATGPVSGFLENPVVGMAPWIVFSLLVGPGRFEIAVGIALASAVVLVVLGRVVHRGSSWKLLEVADVVFFAALAVIGALASDGTLRWLETYAGEIANLTLTVIAFGSMAVRTPFTLQYAREQVDRSLWHAPAFLRTNYLITGVWGLAFLVAALAGGFGDLVLRDPGNIWTGWIIQILAIVAALRFTVWYPGVVRARARGEAAPGGASLLLPVAGLLVPVGIAVLVFDGGAWWLGVALIVAGGLLTKALRARDRSGPRPADRIS